MDDFTKAQIKLDKAEDKLAKAESKLEAAELELERLKNSGDQAINSDLPWLRSEVTRHSQMVISDKATVNSIRAHLPSTAIPLLPPSEMTELAREFGALRATMEASTAASTASATATAHAIEASTAASTASAAATAHAIEAATAASTASTAATTEMSKQLALQNKISHPTPLSRKVLGAQMQSTEQLESTMFSEKGEGDYKDVPELVKFALDNYRRLHTNINTNITNTNITNTKLEFCQNAVIIEKVLSPLLQEALPNMVVFNTETEWWLKSDGGDLKPDATIGPQVVFKPTDREGSKRDFLFKDGNYGKLIWGLQDAYLLIGDGKLVIDNEFPDEDSVGQLGDYLTRLATHVPDREVHNGVLFYASGFTTFQYFARGVMRWKGQRGNWGDAKSKPYLINYFKKCYNDLPDWAKAASVLPTHFNTTSSIFLGRGRDGCVFQLEEKDSCGQEVGTVAVKVGNTTLLDLEFKRYKAITEKLMSSGSSNKLTVTARKCIILPPRNTTVYNEQSALVLNEVGTSLNRDSISKGEVIECYQNLVDECGICQGDPRPENLVEYEGNYLWVDFTRSVEWSELKFIKDMEIIDEAYKAMD